MALRITFQTPRILSAPSSTPLASLPPATAAFPRKLGGWWSRVSRVGRAERVVVRSSLVTVGQVTEINKDTFWPIVDAAAPKIVVLDMYTQWCGPCKAMAPKFEELSEKYLNVVFLKLDCNEENKPLAKELGIRVVPTFKILKDGKIAKEVTGAKFDDLVHAINTVLES